LQTLRQCGEVGLAIGIVSGECHKYADAPQLARRLRIGDERPCGCYSTKRDDFSSSNVDCHATLG
jgi:hypothetical protein